MPELPEVENVAQALRLNLQGRLMTGLKIRFGGVLSQPPRLIRHALIGKRLDRVHRHGKYLLLTFSGVDHQVERSRASQKLTGGGFAADRGEKYYVGDTTHLMIHLRMTGQIFILEGYQPDKHVHLTFDFEGLPVHYRDIRKFGRFTLVEDDRTPNAISHIGPDMLEIGFASWHERVAGRRAPIKSLLLDQGIAAGLGNIYVDEALFRAGVHPLSSPADLSRDELKLLFRSAKSVLRLAIRHGGTTFLNFTNFHGQPGNFRRKLRVYQRTGEPCSRCGTEIARSVVGGRSSHYCPRCQRRP